MNWDESKQALIMDYLKTKSQEAIVGMNIFESPHYFASPQDFAAQVGQSAIYSKEYKIKYLIFSFSQFKNLKKGCEEDPNVFLYYKAQLYRTFQQGTLTDPNSHDLLIADLIKLRNYMLNSADIVTNQITIHDIEQLGDMVNIQQSNFVVGDIGDWVNLRFTIEVNYG